MNTFDRARWCTEVRAIVVVIAAVFLVPTLVSVAVLAPGRIVGLAEVEAGPQEAVGTA